MYQVRTSSQKVLPDIAIHVAVQSPNLCKCALDLVVPTPLRDILLNAFLRRPTPCCLSVCSGQPTLLSWECIPFFDLLLASVFPFVDCTLQKFVCEHSRHS